MGEAKRLQVVDMNQFTKLINLLQKKESDNKVVRDVEMPAEKMELLDSHEQMKKSVKNKSFLAGNNITQFMRKKRKYQERGNGGEAGNGEGQEEDGGDGGGGGGGGGAIVAGRGTKILEIEKRIKTFLKNKKIVKNRRGTLNYKGHDTGVNYDDLLEDLTHDFKKTDTNLSKPIMTKALKVLKKESMPVSYIKNKKIKLEYKTLIDNSGSDDDDYVSSLPSK